MRRREQTAITLRESNLEGHLCAVVIVGVGVDAAVLVLKKTVRHKVAYRLYCYYHVLSMTLKM